METCTPPTEAELEQMQPTAVDAERLWPTSQRRALGQGTFGQVFAATSAESKQPMAVKAIRRTPLGRAKARASTAEAIETIRRSAAEEARLLWRVKCACQDYLLCYRDLFAEDEANYYIATELLQDYVSLAHFLSGPNKGQPTHPMVTYALANNLMAGLRLLRDLQIAHRDIKPRNILVNLKTRRIKYIDFGLSCWGPECAPLSEEAQAHYKIPPPRPSIGMHIVGTASYIAPEAASGEEADLLNVHSLQQTDLWALGLVLFEIVTGGTTYWEAVKQVQGAAMRAPETGAGARAASALKAAFGEQANRIPRDLADPRALLFFLYTLTAAAGPEDSLPTRPILHELLDPDLVEINAPLMDAMDLLLKYDPAVRALPATPLAPGG